MNLKNIHNIISKNIKTFTKVKSRVFHKFLVDIVYGMLISKSVKISEMSRAIECRSETSTKHIYKRLDRNIGQHDVTEVKERVQGMQSELIDENTLIYFDPSEIVKKYGKKFEGMGKIVDGSNGRAKKNGYPINVCIGMKGDEIIPLELNLYAWKEEGFVSENDEYLKPIDAIAHKSKFKGTYVLDMGFDRFAIIRHLILTLTVKA